MKFLVRLITILKKGILFSLEFFTKRGTLATTVLHACYLIYPCVEEIQEMYFDGVSDAQYAVRNIPSEKRTLLF